MLEQKYILTIWNESIFKEASVPAGVSQVHIGTTQDCDVRLKRGLFDVPVSISMHNEKGTWHIAGEMPLQLVKRFSEGSAEDTIAHGDILEVRSSETVLFFLSFSYDFTDNLVCYDTIVDVRNSRSLVIGGAENAQIRLSSPYVGAEYILLERGQEGYILDPSHAPKSAVLNGVRIFQKTEVREYDFIGVADYFFYFKNQVLYTTGRTDMAFSGVSAQPLRNETPAFRYPKFNRSPRMLYQLNREPIQVLNPPEKPARPKDNLVLQLSPALLMLAVTVVTRSGLIGGLGSGSPAFLILSVATMLVGILTTVFSFVYNKKQYKKDVEQWKTDYLAYIEAKRREIEAARQNEQKLLRDIYPSARDLREHVKTFSGRLFERSPEDTDFLYVRAGLGDVPALRQVTCSQEEKIKVENELMQVPAAICEEYARIPDMPVMLHLRESGSIGVVGAPEDRYSFFKSLLLDITIQHSYEDVKIIVLLPQTEQRRYEWIKWMPHVQNVGGVQRGIVCDDASRDNIFESLYALLTQRDVQRSEEDDAPVPHYVVFVLEEYGIKTHPLYKFAPHATKMGISFVYFKEYMESLPKECAEIVTLTGDGGKLFLSKDKQFCRPFVCEQVEDESIQFAAERLAPVATEKIALASRLTAHITLFELLNILSPEDLNLLDRWKRSNVQKSIAAPLGVDAKNSVVYLDLHEKAHGPHGLVAGTTGSGKSEIMQSYILSAAINFHPYEVAFVIIDFKGGGMANQFEHLPHLVGKITDIDSHQMNRSLMSIRAELEKRKRLFAQYNVNHIDGYIGKFRAGETDTALPHLILIVDEFAELKAEQPEFMKELISTARVGRSLGIHLILATQKPAGQVNEQIWSNSRFKLCLKVATKEDSTEVLRSPLASEIREPGRAYLQVGNNEIFTLFQSAYSGASALSDENGNTREFVISEVSFTGKRTVIYERKNQPRENGAQLSQLKALVDYIEDHCIRSGIARLPSICLPPLEEALDYRGNPTGKELLPIGVYDDPGNQIQPETGIRLSDGNIMIFGAAQTGKTMLLHTILRGIAERFSPAEVSVYVLDFASKAMKIYETLPHVGGVMTDSDDETLKNFFKMLLGEIELRKDRFSHMGIGSYESYREIADAPAMPRIVVMIDNLPVFKETCQEYEDSMLTICREGLALGITVIATAKQTAGLSYRYMGSFPVRFAFVCTESSEYNSIFDRCQLSPQNIQGRGLLMLHKTVYEFQAYLPFDGIAERTDTEIRRTENKRIEQIRAFVAQTGQRYSGIKARPVPSIPALLTKNYWTAGDAPFDNYVVPVGLTYSEIEPVTVDLAHVGSVGICGREQFGKSNLVRVLLDYLKEHTFDLPCSVYLLDGYDRQLGEFETCGFVERFTIDCADFEEIVQQFSDAAKERMDILRIGGTLSKEPLLLCVVQNPQIFAAGAVPKLVSDRLKNLLNEAKQLKMCFLFADLENNGEYSPCDMVKLSRDLGQYFLLDDLTNIKLFGTGKFTPNDLRMFRKKLLLGDGYSYSARNGIEKVKLVKGGEVM